MTNIRHPAHAYLLFFGGKLAYLTVALLIPMLVLPFAWWQVVGGVLLMTFANSTVFVLLLIIFIFGVFVSGQRFIYMQF